MNRFIVLFALALIWIGADLWTKQLAVDNLASRSSRWDHSIEYTVEADQAGLTVEQWCVQELGTDLDDELEARTLRAVYRSTADDDGESENEEWLSPTTLLAEGDRLRINYRSVTVVPGFWNHIYVQNFGAAWGMFSERNESFRKPFFIIISIIAVVVMISILRTLAPGQWLLAGALASIVGGAIGNFIDRLRYGYVIDFIDWYITWGGDEKHWPTFNIADVAISVGVTLIALQMLFVKEPPAASTENAPEPDSDASGDDAPAA